VRKTGRYDFEVMREELLAQFGPQHRGNGTGGYLRRNSCILERERHIHGGRQIYTWRALLEQEVDKLVREKDPAELERRLVKVQVLLDEWHRDLVDRT
jgi:hypothetical protein